MMRKMNGNCINRQLTEVRNYAIDTERGLPCNASGVP
jgi:hypothetical protein